MMKEPDLILNMIDTNTKENNQKIIKNEKLKQPLVQNANTNGNTGITNNNHSKNHDDDLHQNHIAEINNTPRTVPVNKNENSASTTSTCDEENRKMLEMIRSNNKVNVLKCNNQIKELHTLLRDKETSHSDFKFYSDRLIRLVVEEGLNQLPYTACKVTTPAFCDYDGVKYIKGVCGVSIMRSGEAMEKGLRECCRSIRIGKILIQSTDDDHKKSSVVYAKFPSDIQMKKILLMYPIMTTGSTVNLAINVLKEHGVTENNILVLCLFSTPSGLQSVNSQYPDVQILTSEIYWSVPTDFGQRYFGTE